MAGHDSKVGRALLAAGLGADDTPKIIVDPTPSPTSPALESPRSARFELFFAVFWRSSKDRAPRRRIKMAWIPRRRAKTAPTNRMAERRHAAERIILNISDYFDRICIIHLPERKDRFDALQIELQALGIDIHGAKVRIPHAPRPADANQFPSRGIYGNFLSHLSILKEAHQDGLENVLVLEDDAIFSRRMVNKQGELIDTLKTRPWDLCFFGHSLKSELRGHGQGLVPHTAGFIWAHCYAVNARALPELIAYLEETMTLAPGDPRGARMYIDAAFTLFRQHHPHIVTLVSNPVLSVQKGSPSNIAGTGWYKSMRWAEPLIRMARAARDQWWRLTA